MFSFNLVDKVKMQREEAQSFENNHCPPSMTTQDVNKPPLTIQDTSQPPPTHQFRFSTYSQLHQQTQHWQVF